MSRFVICAMLCVATALKDQSSGALIVAQSHAQGFVRLRVCNAYPYSAALDIFRGNHEKLTSEKPMQYKTCGDFLANLRSGDKIEFKVDDASMGTFSVTDLPNNDAVLLLVTHSHDTLSTAVSFESRILPGRPWLPYQWTSTQVAIIPQVAIIDTFKGRAKATPMIMDSAVVRFNYINCTGRFEELRYGSVVAVNQGSYNVKLVDTDGKTKAEAQLVALFHESYVILRTGVEAEEGPAYPQDLIVYPNSDEADLLSGAFPFAQASAALFALVFSFSHW